MPDARFLSLKDAIAQALMLGGLDLLNNPARLVSLVLDLADYSLDEVRLFKIQANADLLAPLSKVVDSPSEQSLRVAEKSMIDILVQDRFVEQTIAVKVAQALTCALAKHLGISYAPTPVPQAQTNRDKSPLSAPQTASQPVRTTSQNNRESDWTLCSKAIETAKRFCAETQRSSQVANIELNNAQTQLDTARKSKPSGVLTLFVWIVYLLSSTIVVLIAIDFFSSNPKAPIVAAIAVQSLEPIAAYLESPDNLAAFLIGLLLLVFLGMIIIGRALNAPTRKRIADAKAQLTAAQSAANAASLRYQSALANRSVVESSAQRVMDATPGTQEYQNAIRLLNEAASRMNQ